MASRLERDTEQPESVEELLDTLDQTIDRVKVLYEQYFMGIQKQAPAYLHTDVERKLRDLMQMQIRNTGLRFRLATLQQKYGAYNTYWRRTLRQIENGTYIRNLSKIGREAARTGAAIPDEILRAMPKRMREQVQRDREQALAIAARHGGLPTGDDEELLTLLPEGAPPPAPDADQIAMINEPSQLRRQLKTRTGAHVIDDSDGDVDLNSFFAEAEQAIAPAKPPEPPTPAPLRAARISGQFPAIKMPSATTKPAPPPIPPKVAAPRPSVPVTPPKPNAPAAPSQVTKPNPIAPGSSTARAPVDAEPLVGPFAKEPAKPAAPPPKPAAPPPKPAAPPPRPAPPPGMSDADVAALYATYVKAKELVGEQVGPNGRDKLLKTINAQAPKIMEQYKAKGVAFSVVVKDNQVIIRAKPKP